MAQGFQSVFSKAQSASEVNVFISTYLQPNDYFSRACGVAIDELVRYLQTKVSKNVRSVIKSFYREDRWGKARGLRDTSDIDCVVFINYDGDIRSSIQAMSGPWLQKIIQKIRHSLENRTSPDEFKVVDETRHAVKLRYKRGSFTCDVDLLPAIDILGKGTPQQVYDAMEAASESMRGYCSASLVQLQVEFVKRQQPEVKDLIRFVKHWKNEYLGVKNVKDCSAPSIRLPSYLLELLCIRVWEMSDRPRSVDKRKGLKAVMSLLTERRHPGHLVEWSEYYDPNKYPLHHCTNRVLVRDPANPFNEMCCGFDWYIDDSMIKRTLESPLFKSLSI